MPTKIKHSAINNQADLHEPKYHTGSHKKGGVDPVVIEDLHTDEVIAGQQVVQVVGPGDPNVVAWTDDLTIATIDASSTINAGGTIDCEAGNIQATGTPGNVTAVGLMSAGTTITAGTGLTVTTGGAVITAGDVTATAGNFEATNADAEIFLGGNAVDGTIKLGRAKYGTAPVGNHLMAYTRDAGSYVPSPEFVGGQNHSWTWDCDNPPATEYHVMNDVGSGAYGVTAWGANALTITGTPTWNIGDTITGPLLSEINYTQYISASKAGYISSVDATALRASGTQATLEVFILAIRDLDLIDGTETCYIIDHVTVGACVTNKSKYNASTFDRYADATAFDKTRVLAGDIIFPVFYIASGTFEARGTVNIRIVPTGT